MNTLIWNVRARRRRRAESHLLYAALVSMPFVTILLLVARMANLLSMREHPALTIAAGLVFVAVAGLLAEGRTRALDPFGLSKTVFEPDLPTATKLDRLRRQRTFHLHIAVILIPITVLTLLIAIG